MGKMYTVVTPYELPTLLTDTRLVCTHLNAFLMLNSKIINVNVEYFEEKKNLFGLLSELGIFVKRAK